MTITNLLPKEILTNNVFPYLTGSDVARCSRVCKLWRQAAEDEKLWKILCLKEGIIQGENPKTTYALSFKQGAVFKTGSIKAIFLNGRMSNITHLSPDGKYLASGCRGKICIWNWQEKISLCTFDVNGSLKELFLKDNLVAYVDESRAGIYEWKEKGYASHWAFENKATFIALDRKVVVTSTEKEVVVHSLSLKNILKKLNVEETITCLAVQEESVFFGSICENKSQNFGSVSVWNWQSDAFRVLNVQTRIITSIAIEGYTAAIGSENTVIPLWNWKQNECLQLLDCRNKLETMGYTLDAKLETHVSLEKNILAATHFGSSSSSPITLIWDWRQKEILRMLEFKTALTAPLCLLGNVVFAGLNQKIKIMAFTEKKSVFKKVKDAIFQKE